MLKFIGYRLFELVTCVIMGVVASIFIVPFAGLVLMLLIPNFVLTDEIQIRIVILISACFLVYWWYKAITDSTIETMGFKKKTE